MKATDRMMDVACAVYYTHSGGFRASMRAAIDAALALVPEQPESGWRVVYEQLATKLRDAERALAQQPDQAALELAAHHKVCQVYVRQIQGLEKRAKRAEGKLAAAEERAEQDASLHDALQKHTHERYNAAVAAQAVIAAERDAAAAKLKLAEERLALFAQPAHPSRPAVGETCDWARAKADMQAHPEARWKMSDYTYRFLPGHDLAQVHRNGDWFRSSHRESEQASRSWTRQPDAPAESVPVTLEERTARLERAVKAIADGFPASALEATVYDILAGKDGAK